ncbi:MAG: D-alanine--D-alanine ligase family protein [Candidatus Saccharimonadales bacterium]
MSDISSNSIFAVLNKHFRKVGITTVNNIADLESLADGKPDLVFLGLEYIPSNPALSKSYDNKIWLSDFLDDRNIAYTGSSQAANFLARSKPLAKKRLLEKNLKTADFYVIKQNSDLDNLEALFFPLFVKPTNCGGGFGIDSDSIVHNIEQLRSKVEVIINKLKVDVLVEKYLPGREFSVAVLNDELSNKLLAMPIELVAPLDNKGGRLLSGLVKSANTEQAYKVNDLEVRSEVVELALESFKALGARDYGRIDIRLDETNTAYFLEANLIPSLISGYGSFPKACVINKGLEYEPMIMKIVSLGLTRSKKVVDDLINPDKVIGSAYQSSGAVFGSV